MFKPQLRNYDDFYLDLMAPDYGKFSIENFLMTSSFVDYDFSPFEKALQQGQESKAVTIFMKMYEYAHDKEQFLLEYSIPVHEKQHLFDLASTSFGLDLFMANWYEKGKFYILLDTLKKSGKDVKIPLRKWAKSRDCPKEVYKFLEFYDIGEQYFNELLFAGSARALPSTPQPVTDDIVLIRSQDHQSGVVRPYVGIRRGTNHMVYPINGKSILEGMAFHMQIGAICLIDPKIGKSWTEHFTESEDRYAYFATHELAGTCCNYNPGKMAEMFQFALMPPLVITRGLKNDLSPEELDPGWRFYALADYLLRAASPNPVISDMADDLCVRNGWMLPGRVVQEMMDYTSTFPAGATDVFGIIRKEYVKLSYKPLLKRRERPLLELGYLLSHDLRPPLHRKVMPSGRTEIRRVKDKGEATAWLDYLLMSSLLKGAVEKDYISCPIAYKKTAATIPGEGKCTCEAERSQCFLAGFVDQLGIKFTPFKG